MCSACNSLPALIYADTMYASSCMVFLRYAPVAKVATSKIRCEHTTATTCSSYCSYSLCCTGCYSFVHILWQIDKIKEGFLETEKIQLIQEQLCGFLLDEVISPRGEHYAALTSVIVTGETEEGTSHANKEASGSKEQASGSGQRQGKKN